MVHNTHTKEYQMNDGNLHKLFDLIIKGIDKLPDPPRETFKKQFVKIKEIILESRPPRIMIIGRRGAGKSSLINAIFQEKVAEIGSVTSETGKATWHTFENKKGAIDILDTRGIGDKTKPESSNFEHAIDEIKHELENQCPDAILFLCKAKEVDSHIAQDIQSIVFIRSFINGRYNYDIPLGVVVTQIDELDPKRIKPPYDNVEKQRNIKVAVDTLGQALKPLSIDILKLIPVSSYAEYDNKRIIYDEFYNVDILVEYLIDILPHTAQLQLARLAAVKKMQRKFAHILIASTATICAGIAATPVPVADLIPITSAQVAMIAGIACISGRDLSKKSAMEFLAAIGVNVGIGYGLREGARALIKFVFPGVGNAISAAVAAAGTWGIGEAAMAYFIENATVEEAKRRYEKAKKEHTEE